MRPARRALLLALLLPLAGLCACAPAEAPTPAPPPNLLLVSLDTLRADALGSYGARRDPSPALDALGREGVVFERALSVSPWTLPAHGSLLTGLYPRRHGANHARRALRRDATTLAEQLREHGYRTAAFVNAQLVGRRYGFARGFERFRNVPEELAARRPSEAHDLAEAWLADAPEPPWFLFLHVYDTHSDYRSEPAYEETFAGGYTGPVDGSTAQLGRMRRGELDLDAAGRRHLRDLYAASVRQLDERLGALLAGLAARGQAEDTLVVVTSDHGEEFFEHGSVLHGRTQYEEVLRVPWLMRGPGVPAGLRVEEPVSLVDAMPTLLALLGVPAPAGLDGHDLSPLLRGEASPSLAARLIFSEADHHPLHHDATRSVRRGDFKLVLDRARGAMALYDLARDPAEQRDVRAEHPELVEELRSRLDAFEAHGREGTALPALDPETVERLRALGYL